MLEKEKDEIFSMIFQKAERKKGQYKSLEERSLWLRGSSDTSKGF